MLPTNGLMTETVPVGVDAKPLQPVLVDVRHPQQIRRNAKPTLPVYVNTRPQQPVHMNAGLLQQVHTNVKPARPVQLIAKPQQLHTGLAPMEFMGVFSPVWIYNGGRALMPPGSQSHADEPHPQSWPRLEIGITETVYSFSEVDHPLSRQARAATVGMHDLGKEQLPIVHGSEEANKAVLERWNWVGADQGRPSALLKVIKAAELYSIRNPPGVLENNGEQQRAALWRQQTLTGSRSQTGRALGAGTVGDPMMID
ncbi:hypothetical protein G7Y79_00012g033270 [Physcia stellaris]|nr:hypothetical protein G7Y79_00012g033270 [Physcia stellaris]